MHSNLSDNILFELQLMNIVTGRRTALGYRLESVSENQRQSAKLESECRVSGLGLLVSFMHRIIYKLRKRITCPCLHYRCYSLLFFSFPSILLYASNRYMYWFWGPSRGQALRHETLRSCTYPSAFASQSEPSHRCSN